MLALATAVLGTPAVPIVDEFVASLAFEQASANEIPMQTIVIRRLAPNVIRRLRSCERPPLVSVAHSNTRVSRISMGSSIGFGPGIVRDVRARPERGRQRTLMATDGN
jgi:hypothetical protein